MAKVTYEIINDLIVLWTKLVLVGNPLGQAPRRKFLTLFGDLTDQTPFQSRESSQGDCKTEPKSASSFTKPYSDLQSNYTSHLVTMARTEYRRKVHGLTEFF